MTLTPRSGTSPIALGLTRQASDASTLSVDTGETCVAGVWIATLKGEDFAGQAMVDIGGECVLLMWVADGHGGGDAAEYCHR